MNDKIIFYSTPYKGYYANENGDIYSTFSKKVLTPKIDKDGYLEYGLTVNNKIKYLRGHRIIAETFIPNPLNKPTVNHIDGNKSNNSLSNLEWSTYSENNSHRFKILKVSPPNKFYIDIYKDNSLIEKNCSLADCLNSNISRKYLKTIQEGFTDKYFYFFEKNEDKTINVYWNGKIIFNFKDAKEAANKLNMRLNCIYTRCIRHKDVEFITKDYNFVFRNIVKDKV